MQLSQPEASIMTAAGAYHLGRVTGNKGQLGAAGVEHTVTAVQQ